MLAKGIEANIMGNWKIRDSFEEMIMLMHKSWKNNEIRLV